MGKYKSQERYDAENTRNISLKLNRKTDADILEALEKESSIQGFIKQCIREHIGAEK